MKKTAVQKIVPVFIVPFLLFHLISCKKKDRSGLNDISSIKTITTMNDLYYALNADSTRMLVFDFYADWCMPCKVLLPIIGSLSTDNKDRADFFKINIDKSPDIAASFQVQGIPYVVFVRNKRMIHSLTGVHPGESYEKVLNRCGTAESAQACAQLLK